MPTASVNGIDINYKLEGDGDRTVVLVNGLADDLETWVLQMDDLLAAGYRVLRFDNRGIGASSKPAGPYSSRMLADDAKALADQLGISGFHLMGVSMGGMIAQEYALASRADLRSVTFGCTYAAPGPFCSRMFSMWADMAPVLGVPFIMRDVSLWAFTVPFFEQRGAEAAEFETAMRYMDQPVHAYLAQLAVITGHDTTSRRAPAARAARPVRRDHAGPRPDRPRVQPVLHHRRHARLPRLAVTSPPLATRPHPHHPNLALSYPFLDHGRSGVLGRADLP